MICLIGNSGLHHKSSDGQTEKTRLYFKKIKDEGFEVFFVDLEDFFKHFITILFNISKGVKTCDRIVLLSAERGTRVLVPFINWKNRKLKKPFVLPLVGISVLHYSIDKLNTEEKLNFLLNNDYSLTQSNKKIVKELDKINYILPETDLLTNVYKRFFKLNNVYTLNNFRETSPLIQSHILSEKELKIVYLSRVTTVKGIFDLLEVVHQINKNKPVITLDIYGRSQLDSEEYGLFKKLLNNNIHYHNQVCNDKVIALLSGYDLFVFPTRYMGEGTPGVLTESLIAGTPILTSNFPQAHFLLKDGYDSLFFKMFDKNDLKEKLLWAINNKTRLVMMRNNAMASAKKFTYDYNRHLFLKYVCGVDK